MTLDELKDGNVIETKDGSLFVTKKSDCGFFGGIVIRFYELTNNRPKVEYFTKTDWKVNLSSALEDKNLDIVKIYEDYTLETLLFEVKEVPLTELESFYLKKVIVPFKEHISKVEKVCYDTTDNRPTNTYIKFFYKENDVKHKKLFEIPVLNDKLSFKGLEVAKQYSLDDLGLK